MDVAKRFPKVASGMHQTFDVWWDEVRPLMIHKQLATRHPG